MSDLLAQSSPEAPLGTVARGRGHRRRQRARTITVLAILLVVAAAASLCFGRTSYPIGDVVRVLLGEQVPGASFTVGELRLPRVLTGILVGAAFGAGGVIFQTMLRNALASPDIIGVTWGASAAAVVAITQLGTKGSAISGIAFVAALSVALVIYVLAWKRGVLGSRFVLIGIGVGAMLQAVVTWSLSHAQVYDASEAMLWLSGSLNNAFWEGFWQTAIPLLVLLVLAGCLSGRLSLLQLGDDTAKALGLRTERSRLLLVVVATGLIAVGTAAVGPIAFVAFLSGPVSHRIVRGPGSPVLPAALVGALLVTLADLAGQHLFDTRFPVGVITGLVGAPYLLWLLARTNRTGGNL